MPRELCRALLAPDTSGLLKNVHPEFLERATLPSRFKCSAPSVTP